MSKFRRIAATLQTFWSMIGITLVMVLLLDACLGVVMRRREEAQFRAYMDTYPDEDRAWVPEYTREMLEDDAVEWRPYVYYRRRPYAGTYFQVDADGLRHTWNATSSGAEVKRIFTFGGSTMWGTDARPDYTIASSLSRELTTANHKVHVTNFGEGGYVSTQGMITLLLELRRGNIPDVVVFYDGCNEIATAWQNGKAGLSSNENNRVEEFNADRRSRIQKGLKLIPWIVRFSTGLGHRLSKEYSVPAEARADLEEQTVRVYRENLRVVELLGKEYGFKTLFYWQPIIFQKDHLSPNETRAATEFSYIKDFGLAVNRRLKEDSVLSQQTDFHDIGDLFRSDEAPVFIDMCHLSERGSEAIARRMSVDLEPLLGLAK